MVKINPQQTANSKSTTDQIFLLRFIVGLAKRSNIVLYIVSFDLSKAFDCVSRYKLFKTLVKMGIGTTTMFKALKNMYSNTRCILNTDWY